VGRNFWVHLRRESDCKKKKIELEAKVYYQDGWLCNTAGGRVAGDSDPSTLEEKGNKKAIGEGTCRHRSTVSRRSRADSRAENGEEKESNAGKCSCM